MKSVRKVAFVSAVWNGKIQQILRGALRYADGHPPTVVRAFGRERDFNAGDLSNTPQTLRDWMPDGILSTLESDALESLLATLGPTSPPMVNCMATRRFPGVTEVVGTMPDQVAKSIEHFRQLGLRSFGFLTFDVSSVVTQRQREIVHSLVTTAGPAEFERMFLREPVPDAVVEAYGAPVTPVPGRVAAWLKGLPKPVGILAIELGGGGYVIRVCKALGLRVPEDVAVIGGCDDADACLANDPPLTSVGVPGDAIGFEALRVLERLIAGEPPPDGPVRVTGAELQVRQSTGQRRAEICDIAAATEYIRQNACRGLHVQEVIRATQGVSSMTFHKHFLAATGMTPGEAIRTRQFEEARRLLASTQLSMSLVAEMSGFGSANDFARAFRQHEGTTPTAYRQRGQATASKL